MRKAAPAIVAALVATLAPFAACSDGAQPATSDAEPVDAGADERGRDKDWHVEPPDAGPSFNADGWVRLDYPNCNLYAAPSKEKLPPRIAWEPCSLVVDSLGIACKQIKSTLPAPTNGGSTSIGVPSAWVDPLGKAWVIVGISTGANSVKVVTEADGPVHQALTYQRGQCSITDGSLSSNRAVFMVVRSGSSTLPEERGAVGGDIDSVPLRLESWADGAGRSYRAGPSSYFALGPENAVRSWTPGAPPIGKVSLTDPGQMLPSAFVGDDLFFEVGNLSYSRIKVYAPANGARDLISFGNDVSSNAADFGTDGVDMVWVEAFGRSNSGDPWTTMNIMTSKFTANAAQVEKRRLRSESGAIGGSPFTVGCGYAAHFISSPKDGNIVRIVRLSDGHSWRLPEVFTDAGPYWLFQTPRAITCDEIFVNINDTGRFNTARIRLDSLGPGEPAD